MRSEQELPLEAIVGRRVRLGHDGPSRRQAELPALDVVSHPFVIDPRTVREDTREMRASDLARQLLEPPLLIGSLVIVFRVSPPREQLDGGVSKESVTA